MSREVGLMCPLVARVSDEGPGLWGAPLDPCSPLAFSCGGSALVCFLPWWLLNGPLWPFGCCVVAIARGQDVPAPWSVFISSQVGPRAVFTPPSQEHAGTNGLSCPPLSPYLDGDTWGPLDILYYSPSYLTSFTLICLENINSSFRYWLWWSVLWWIIL